MGQHHFCYRAIYLKKFGVTQVPTFPIYVPIIRPCSSRLLLSKIINTIPDNQQLSWAGKIQKNIEALLNETGPNFLPAIGWRCS